MQRPTSGQLTTSATHIDRNFIAMGNPNLKPYWEWNNNLLLAYFSPNNDNQIVLQYTPKYRYHPFVPTLSVDNNIVYSRPQKISHSFDNVLNLFGSWYPVSWLEFSPYVEYYYSTLDTPSQDVRLSYFRTGCTITISRNSWALTLAANSPTKEVSGDLTMRGSAQFAPHSNTNTRIGLSVPNGTTRHTTTTLRENAKASRIKKTKTGNHYTPWCALPQHGHSRREKHADINASRLTMNIQTMV